jgi:hypothetical protein
VTYRQRPFAVCSRSLSARWLSVSAAP